MPKLTRKIRALLLTFPLSMSAYFSHEPVSIANSSSNRAGQKSGLEAIEREPKKNQVLYLIQSGEIERAIGLYRQLAWEQGRYDFSLLRELGHILLLQGAKSHDDECQLISMYGTGIAGMRQATEAYQFAFSSHNATLQLAAVQFLSQNLDDQAEEALLMAFSSPFLITRLEAAHALANRKSNRATGMIDSLMQKLPPFIQVYFPELFAMIGSIDAIEALQRLARNPSLEVRLAAITAAARSGFDNFLPVIRAGATHSDYAEQETCAAALGALNDAHSIPLLKKLAQSPNKNVALAAYYSLSQLGEHDFRKAIIESARNQNPFAIHLLSAIPTATDTLKMLLHADLFDLRVNAALVLLKKRDPACVPTLLQILIRNEKDFGFQPLHSIGGALLSWKVVPSCAEYAKKTNRDIPSITLMLREQILAQALELPEEDFLILATAIFEKKQRDLIPFLVKLLENLNSAGATQLLKQQSRRVGSPFIRNYCHLALYRMKVGDPHGKILFSWVKKQKDCPLFRFRPLLPWTERHSLAYLLTPEETSRLMIESLEALAEQHDPQGIDLILSAIQSGHPKNRYALAGLLVKALQ
ncbi:MAG: HEAT repeat domain-containing protein [Chlamydiota bacterium]